MEQNFEFDFLGKDAEVVDMIKPSIDLALKNFSRHSNSSKMISGAEDVVFDVVKLEDEKLYRRIKFVMAVKDLSNLEVSVYKIYITPFNVYIEDVMQGIVFENKNVNLELKIYILAEKWMF